MSIIHGKIDELKWERFLTSRSDSTIYHTPGWSRFLIQTFNYEPFHIFAEDNIGDIKGFLPLFKIPNTKLGKELCSVPFAHRAGYVGEPSFIDEVLDSAIEVARRTTGGSICIKDHIDHKYLNIRCDFCTHILELSSSSEETWGKLDRGSTRWAVNKARKLGVTVRESREPDDIDAFYHLNCLTKKALGVPCHPYKFFKNLMDQLPKNTKLYLSEFKGETIGAGLMEYHGDKVIYGYGAANPRNLQMHPYDSFLWKSIEDACHSGYHTFDFGRTSKENTGLINFKNKWGTKELDLCYSSDKHTKSSINRLGAVYKLGNYGLKHMPMSIYKGFSKTVFNLMG